MKIGAAIIHFQTPDLLEDAVRSFRQVYPDIPLRIVDNGSRDGSAETVERLADTVGGPTWVEMLPTNVFHGPAMHHVLEHSPDDLVFFLDSDTITRRGGFLEPMADVMTTNQAVLACGQVVRVDHRGFASSRGTVSVPASAYMLVRRDLYLGLPPFRHHGLPVLETCREAQRRGLEVASWPVEQYIDHLGRGTAARYGYGLGLRSRWEYLLHRLGL